jgi:hypothetical protein
LPFNTPFDNPKEDTENKESDSLFVLILPKEAHCDANPIAASGDADEIFLLQQSIEPWPQGGRN